MRTCHVIHNTHVGGAETSLFELLRQRGDRGENTLVLSLMDRGPVAERIARLGIPVEAIGLRRASVPNPLKIAQLAASIRRFRPDLVQTWTYHADLLGGLAAKLAGNYPVVWNIRHGSLDPALDSRSTLLSARLCAQLSSVLPGAIVLNSHAARAVHAAAGYAERKMQVIPNGFDDQSYRPSDALRRGLRAELGIPDATPLIGMCGRFHRHKGFDLLIQAAEQVTRHHPAARFVLAGADCDHDNRLLGQWLEESRLRSRFHLLGRRDDMPRLLASLDLYVLASRTEAMPNVVGEAMLCRVPCVVTDVGDAARLVGESGRVVVPQEPIALAQEIVAALELPERDRSAAGRRARAHIMQHYDLATMADAYERVWTRHRRPSKRVDESGASGASADRPKLVHITTIPLTPWLFLRGQNRFMRDQGFDVHLVSGAGPYRTKVASRDPVTTHEVPLTRAMRPWHDVRALVHLILLLRRLRPEIVQVSTPKAALLGAIAAWLTRVPVRIYQVRGLTSENERGWTRRIFQMLERLTGRLCNAWFVNAHSLLRYAHEHRILAGHQGTVVGSGTSNGVDLDRFHPPPREGSPRPSVDLPSAGDNGGESMSPVIGFVGRLTRDKGIEELAEAWLDIRREFPTARLLLVGPWEHEDAVSHLCRNQLEDDPRVILTGMQDETTDFYAKMDVFVFPSHGTEGFPNAPLEAAAMGLPVVATRVIGSVDAVVDGITGTLIAPRSSHSLRDALLRYLRNRGLRESHGQAGQARVRAEFGTRRLWQSFHAEYVHLLRVAGLTPRLPVGKDDAVRHAA